jgi:nucleoporin NUP82
MNADFKLTPDTLRYIGTTVAELSSQIHEIQLAVRAAETRSMLQRQELARVFAKCREMQAAVERLKGPQRIASEARWETIQTEQKVLLRRLDRMLQALMEKASPELSEHETKWFEELKRMKEEISGSGRYDEGSLAARTRLVCLLISFNNGCTE